MPSIDPTPNDESGSLATADETTTPGTSPTRRATKLSANQVVGLTLMLCVGFVIWRDHPREIANWHHAAYYHHIMNDDCDAALQSINRALTWTPEDVGLWMSAGNAAMATKDYPQSWSHFDHASELLSENYPNAVEAMAGAKNGAAYARALGNAELDKARVDVDEALAALPRELAMVDTRGYVAYLQDDLAQALEDSHDAVTQSLATYEARREEVRRAFRYSIRRRTMLFKLRQLDEEVEELLTHRALVYEKLGMANAAKRDQSRAKFHANRAKQNDAS